MKKTNWSEVTAIFGGTFDPPHLGHQVALNGLLRVPAVKRVIVMPSAIPPQKSPRVSSRHRLEMARLAFSKDAEISELEIQSEGRGRPSYSFDTLSEMGQKIPNLAFAIGIDQLEGLPSWHRFPEVLGLCHWIVLKRDLPSAESRTEQAITSLEGSGLLRRVPAPDWPTWRVVGERQLMIVPTSAPALSSSGIREAIAKTGQIPPHSLPEPVAAYLKQNRLYGIPGA